MAQIDTYDIVSTERGAIVRALREFKAPLVSYGMLIITCERGHNGNRRLSYFPLEGVRSGLKIISMYSIYFGLVSSNHRLWASVCIGHQRLSEVAWAGKGACVGSEEIVSPSKWENRNRASRALLYCSNAVHIK